MQWYTIEELEKRLIELLINKKFFHFERTLMMIYIKS